jgi:glycine/D-amino acid oxidase-like deaminating enzyme
VEVRVNDKFKVSARKLVIACGYESKQFISKKIEELVSTFAIISEPFSKQDFWLSNALIWETAMPYLYMKVTDDWRILVGGKDAPFYDPVKRDKILPSKARQLEKAFHKLFPQIDFKTDFQWAGTFSTTKDGLPYIGSIPERPHTFFALGYGGNGITFSEIAAQLICEQLSGNRHPDIDLFSFDR